MQGITCITKAYRLIDLVPLIHEAAPVHPGQRWPSHIGGVEVKALIGMKNPHLYPRQKFVLPSRLAMFESLLVDIHGSRLCFRGPHPVFTDVYWRIGGNCHLLQSFRSKAASTYLAIPCSGSLRKSPTFKLLFLTYKTATRETIQGVGH
jgi:hypothetical protein